MSAEPEPRTDLDEPQTLRDAHELVWNQHPARSASDEELREYHRCCAHIYAEVADIDRRHHHEALACAKIEREAAEQFVT